MRNKETRTIVGFDLDGTILSNFKVKLRVAKAMGVNLLPEQTPAELIMNYFPEDLYRKFQNTVYDSKEALSPVLMKGVGSILADLKKKKIPFYLISRRKSPEPAIKVMQKLELWPKYFNKKNSFFVHRPEDKDKKAIELGVTHYIDDELKVINALQNVPNRYLFDQFDVFKKADHYIKIGSWSEFKKHLFKNA